MGRTTALNVGIALSLAVVAAVVALIVYIAAPNALGTGEPRQQQAAADQAQQVAAASDLQNKQQHAETTTIEVDANLKGKENESVPEEQQQDEQARTLIEPRASAPHRQEASSSGDAPAWSTIERTMQSCRHGRRFYRPLEAESLRHGRCIPGHGSSHPPTWKTHSTPTLEALADPTQMGGTCIVAENG